MRRSRSRPKQPKTRVKVRARPVTARRASRRDAAAFFDRSSLTYDTSESHCKLRAARPPRRREPDRPVKRDTILGFKPRVKRAARRAASLPGRAASRRRARRRTRSRPRCRPRSRRCGRARRRARRAAQAARAPRRRGFDAMARDGRLNRTSARRRSYRRRVANNARDDADAAAAAADAGRAPPAADEPRATASFASSRATRTPRSASALHALHGVAYSSCLTRISPTTTSELHLDVPEHSAQPTQSSDSSTRWKCRSHQPWYISSVSCWKVGVSIAWRSRAAARRPSSAAAGGGSPTPGTAPCRGARSRSHACISVSSSSRRRWMPAWAPAAGSPRRRAGRRMWQPYV